MHAWHVCAWLCACMACACMAMCMHGYVHAWPCACMAYTCMACACMAMYMHGMYMHVPAARARGASRRAEPQSVASGAAPARAHACAACVHACATRTHACAAPAHRCRQGCMCSVRAWQHLDGGATPSEVKDAHDEKGAPHALSRTSQEARHEGGTCEPRTVGALSLQRSSTRQTAGHRRPPRRLCPTPYCL